MNKDIIKGHWHEIKGKLKQQWGDLTDDEITKIDGSYEELEGILTPFSTFHGLIKSSN